MIRIVVTGARSWENPRPIQQVFMKLIPLNNRDYLIITGGATGVDKIAAEEAGYRGAHVAVIKAMWPAYSHAAGPYRNKVMLSLKPSLVLAFHWDIEHESKGTKDCLRQAEALGLRTKLIKVPKHIAMPSGFARKKP